MPCPYLRPDLVSNARYLSAWSDAIIAANEVLRGQLFGQPWLEHHGLRGLQAPLRAIASFECPNADRTSALWLGAFEAAEVAAYKEARALQPHADTRPEYIQRARRRNRSRT